MHLFKTDTYICVVQCLGNVEKSVKRVAVTAIITGGALLMDLQGRLARGFLINIGFAPSQGGLIISFKFQFESKETIYGDSWVELKTNSRWSLLIIIFKVQIERRKNN